MSGKFNWFNYSSVAVEFGLVSVVTADVLFLLQNSSLGPHVVCSSPVSLGTAIHTIFTLSLFLMASCRLPLNLFDVILLVNRSFACGAKYLLSTSYQSVPDVYVTYDK